MKFSKIFDMLCAIISSFFINWFRRGVTNDQMLVYVMTSIYDLEIALFKLPMRICS